MPICLPQCRVYERNDVLFVDYLEDQEAECRVVQRNEIGC